MPPGQPIAYGRTAEIYAWGDDQVLKLFYDWVPERSVRREAHIARAVHAAGLPVPGVGEIVEIDDRLGLAYERVEGIPMGDVMVSRPWRLVRLARRLAELHAEMHAVEGMEGLPSQRERLANKIQQAQSLGAGLREAALRALGRMSGGNRLCLCHGDFHPWNALLTGGRAVVIDWPDATGGNPLADVARTAVILDGVKKMGQPVTWRDKVVVRWCLPVYLRRYFELRPGGEEEYQGWRPIVAAGRMSEGIAGLEDWLRLQASTLAN
jgi:Ser/Thr protein kinase RdoA (MazF antagonist)